VRDLRFGRVLRRHPFAEARKALATASTPGAADKVVVTFDA
jgi:hypothetical protein